MKLFFLQYCVALLLYFIDLFDNETSSYKKTRRLLFLEIKQANITTLFKKKIIMIAFQVGYIYIFKAQVCFGLLRQLKSGNI